MSRTAKIQIEKQNGELEAFDERKLRHSLRRAGARGGEIDQVVGEVHATLHDGIATHELYRAAFRALRRLRRPAAARYSLKRAIQELGPSGFPFEHLVAGLLRAAEQRPTTTSQHLRGSYVRHEIDVVVGKGANRDLYECKFRGRSEGKVDVKIAMYVYGRATDLRGVRGGYHRFGIVTNGRFTGDAIAFGEGMGLTLLGWDHPRDDGLQVRIDRHGLHPITALPSLPRAAQRILLDRGLVLCRELRVTQGALGSLGMRATTRSRVEAECAALCDGDEDA